MKATANSIDHDKCIKCSKCVSICPVSHLDLIADKIQEIEDPIHACIVCAHCMSVCPTKAIVIKGYDYADFERLPDELPKLADFELLLKARRSCRRYQPVPVSREDIDKIIEVTSTAPMGFPPHSVEILVFDSRDKIEAFLPHAVRNLNNWKFAFGSPFFRALMRLKIPAHLMYSMVKDVLPAVLGVLKDHDKGVDHLTYDATAMLLFHSDKFASSYDENCLVAITYAMLAAEGLGLGSCIIGLIPPMFENDKKLREIYKIPEKNEVKCCLILGHPRSTHNRNIPRDLKSVRWL